MGADFHWDDQAIATTRQLYAKGEPFSRIALAIGCPSRNAVIGKVHRLGLDRRGRPKAEPKTASIPKTKAPKVAKTRSPHPGNIMAKGAARAKERQEGFQAIADKALERFDDAVTASRPAGGAGVLFLDRGLFQCAMPLPGWDDASIHEKRVCGAMVVLPTSYCRACSKIVWAPPRFREFKDRGVGAPA